MKKVTEDWVDWHITKGCINGLPSKPTFEDYCRILKAELVAEIVELESTKIISHKTAVFLMKYYMVQAWYINQSEENIQKIRDLLDSE